MADYGLIPQSVIDALNRKRSLSALEAKLAGKYANPEEQWGVGNIVRELDPVHTVPRGIQSLRRINPEPLRNAYLNLAYGRNDPMTNRAAGMELLSGLGGVADLSMAIPYVGPAVKGAKILGREAARRSGEYLTESGLIPHVVKPEGGQWADPTREKLKKTIEERAAGYDPEISKWLSSVSNKYFLNRMGSPSDDIRLLLEQNISHLPEDRLSGLASDLTNTEKDILRQKRRYEGFPAEGVSDTAAGKRWELMTDEWINPNPARVYQDPRFLSEAPWAGKLDPSTPIYSNERGMNYLFTETGMPEIANAVRREIKEGNLRPEQLNKVSLSDAVKLAHAQRLADEAALAKDLPLAMELPEGYSWRELTHEDPNTLRKILEREGKIMQNCIGGYCEDVTDEGVRLFSLRDPAGNPHVNIEVRPSEVSDELPLIRQIKGKQNEAPTAEYIPYVQQFIKEQGPFSEIRDLGNAGMIDLRRAREYGVFPEDIPGMYRELDRIFPVERGIAGARVLAGQHGVRISPDQMTRELLRNMEGNYTSTPELMQYLQRIEPRPIEQGYSKYWDNLIREQFKDIDKAAEKYGTDFPNGREPEINFAEGGAVNYDELYEFKDYGTRETGERKESGALGEIRMPNGRDIMTEYSINPGGKGEMPSIVEGMHPADLNYLMRYAENPTGDFPEGVEAVAIHSAAKRRAQGKSPFWNRAEDKGYAEGGEVDTSKYYATKEQIDATPELSKYFTPSSSSAMQDIVNKYYEKPAETTTAQLQTPTYANEIEKAYAQNVGGQFKDPYQNYLMVKGNQADIPYLLQQYQQAGNTGTPDWAVLAKNINQLPVLASSWDASGATPVSYLQAWNSTTPITDAAPEGYWDALKAYNTGMSLWNPQLAASLGTYDPKAFASYNAPAYYAMRKGVYDRNSPIYQNYNPSSVATEGSHGDIPNAGWINSYGAQGFAEGGEVKDPFANMSYPEKFALLARGAKKRYIDYYAAANKHGEYPDILAADLKSKYPVELGTSRENRTPLDVAINYGGGYDFAANPSVPARDVRDMAKAYQLWDYMTSFRDKAKADAIGDYYENMAGVEAGLAGRGKGRMPQEDIVKASAAYGKRKATASPAYDTNFAEGGEVDYDSMYEFK